MKFVNNYQGKRAEVAAPEQSPFRVADYMARKLITFKPEQSMHEVTVSLLKNRISGAPVVNDENELVGIISEGNCLKQISESRYHNLPITEGKVEQYMTKSVMTIDSNADIFEVASKFLNNRIRRFPVLENGKLVGQISQKDVMKAVLDLKSTTW